MMCCMIMNAAIEPIEPHADGNGNYELTTAAELYWFADYVNQGNLTANAILTADITVNESVLDSNGDLASSTFETWTPIGGDGNGYKGEFNGNGHTISGLYIKDTAKNRIGLFGVMVKGAYIHDLGVKDSYFSGNNWVAGFCGDFGGGRIENCWNAATVISNSNNSDGCCAGGIAASCWTDASVKGCYNIGKVTAQYDIQCGGICGVVNSTVSDCVTLDVCSVVCKDIRSNAQIINVAIKDINAFKSGEVCWILNNGVTDNSQKWYQTLGEGKDVYPMLDNTRGIVYALGKNCDGSGKGYSNTYPGEVTQDAHTIEYHPYKAPTEMEDGNIEYWHCSVCGQNFANSDCTKLITGSVIIPKIKGSWTILEQPTCSTYGTMQNPANTSELRLVPKVAHHFGDDDKCTVCGHAAPTKYNGTPATSLVTITESNYAAYGLTETNKSCVKGWTVITTAEEFMKYINNNGEPYIRINAFLAEDIILDNTESLPERGLYDGRVFDGTGHTISNVQRNDQTYVGLFYASYGIIRNLGLIAPDIVVNGSFGGCICASNIGTIENCFVIDGSIKGTGIYGIANQTPKGKIINCYAITNVGNVGSNTVTNSYGATEGSNDFYSNTLNALNGQKVNGMSWYHSSTAYPVMMPSMIYHPATATCTESGLKEYWECTVCNKLFLDATHTQETTLEDLPSLALGHNLSLVGEKAHCSRCEQDFEDFFVTDNKPVLLTKGDGKYYLEASDGFTLKDAVSYLAPVGFTVMGNLTYARTFNNTGWQAWFVPFDMTITDKLLNDYEFAKFAGTYTDATGQFFITIVKMKSGDTLLGNRAYFIKSKSTGEKAITVSNAEVCGSGNKYDLVMHSAEQEITVTGIYEKKTATSDDCNWYAYGGGTYQQPAVGQSLNPMRFYLTITPRSDNYYDLPPAPYAKIDIMVIGDEPTDINSISKAESDSERMYNLNGQAVGKDFKGVVVKNGKKYINR